MIYSPPADDFDPMALAFEELNFIRRLGLTPSRWTVGAEASAQLAARALFGEYSPAKGLQILELLGIPVTVDPSINPWTVKLSCEETYNPVS
jgi:hypothetical protein